MSDRIGLTLKGKIETKTGSDVLGERFPKEYQNFKRVDVYGYGDIGEKAFGVNVLESGTEVELEVPTPDQVYGFDGVGDKAEWEKAKPDLEDWQENRRFDYLRQIGQDALQVLDSLTIEERAKRIEATMAAEQIEVTVLKPEDMRELPDNLDEVRALIIVLSRQVSSLRGEVQSLRQTVEKLEGVEEENAELKEEVELLRLPIKVGDKVSWSAQPDEQYEVAKIYKKEGEWKTDLKAHDETIAREINLDQVELIEQEVNDLAEKLGQAEASSMSDRKEAIGALEMAYKGKEVESGRTVAKFDHAEFDEATGTYVLVLEGGVTVNATAATVYEPIVLPPGPGPAPRSVPLMIRVNEGPLDRVRRFLGDTRGANRLFSPVPAPSGEYELKVDKKGQPYYIDNRGKKRYLEKRIDRRAAAAGAVALAAVVAVLSVVAFEALENDDHPSAAPVPARTVTNTETATVTTARTVTDQVTVTAPASEGATGTTGPTGATGETGPSGNSGPSDGGNEVTIPKGRYDQLLDEEGDLLRADSKNSNLRQKLADDETKLAAKQRRIDALEKANKILQAKKAKQAAGKAVAGREVTVSLGDGYTNELQKLFPGHSGIEYFRLHIHLLKKFDANYLVGVAKYEHNGDWRLAKPNVRVHITPEAYQEALQFFNS